jgi:hypothetical protein
MIGSLAGDWLPGHLPRSLSLGPWTWSPTLFMLPVIFFSFQDHSNDRSRHLPAKKFKEVRPVEPIRHREFLFSASATSGPSPGYSYLMNRPVWEHREPNKVNQGKQPNRRAIGDDPTSILKLLGPWMPLLEASEPGRS